MSNEKIPNIIPSEFILQTEHKIYVDLDYYAERTQELQRQVDNYFKTLKIIEKENDRLQNQNKVLEKDYTKLKEAADEMEKMLEEMKHYTETPSLIIDVNNALFNYKHLTNKP